MLLLSSILLGCVRPVPPAPAPAVASSTVRRAPEAPRDARAWYLTGQVAEARGDLETAAEAFRWVTLLDGNRPWSWLELARFQERVGSAQDAVQAYANAARTGADDVRVLDDVAAAYYRAGMHEKAIETWERAQTLSPDPERAVRLQERL